LSVVEQIYDGEIPDVKPAVKKKLKAFVELVRTLRKLADEVSYSAPLPLAL
jgi:DNA helicase-2/ATP-dependent DNA helicase PcrA